MEKLQRTAVRTLQALALVVLLVLWACNTPYHQISDFIGAHFPWPAAKPWKWSAILLEGAVVQLALALPAAGLLRLVFRGKAVVVALVLAGIFALRSLRELPSAINPPYGTAFILYLVLVHFLLLVGLAAVSWRRPSGSRAVPERGVDSAAEVKP